MPITKVKLLLPTEPQNTIGGEITKLECQWPFLLETKTSFQRDVETKGRQSEWDLFRGPVLRYGHKFDIPADNTKETLDTLMQNLS